MQVASMLAILLGAPIFERRMGLDFRGMIRGDFFCSELQLLCWVSYAEPGGEGLGEGWVGEVAGPGDVAVGTD